jgi:hypothetical protein
MCHPRCQPKFYWSNEKPADDGNQTSLFEGEQSEKAIQPGDT